MFKPTFLSDEYQVSDEGVVLSKSGNPMHPSVNFRGYEIVNLMIDGKRVGVAVHTLVARAFCPGYAPGLTVNHKDGNKRNNNANNLEWMTSFENVRYSYDVLGYDPGRSNNPNAKPIFQLDYDTKLCVNHFPSVMDAAMYMNDDLDYKEDYKKLRHAVNRISGSAIGRRKSYKGYKWRYLTNPFIYVD